MFGINTVKEADDPVMGNSTPTVAVIDDSLSSRKLFSKSADNLGIELMTFTSAEESLEYLQNQKPDLMFLNIMMPDKDGLTFLKELRESPLHEDTPVVMITSKDYAQDRTVAKDLGAIDFMTKPIPIQAITDVVLKYTEAEQLNTK